VGGACFAETRVNLLRNKFRFSIAGKPLYPHIKLTRERFPRILATRLIADDDAEYFGPFLNRSAARVLLDFLNRTFRLRSCEIEIDGSFNYPCTMHYKRRCFAPCVADLISEAEYSEIVALVRLFLMGDSGLFRATIGHHIAGLSENFDYEGAAKFRDILDAVEGHWADPRSTVKPDALSDTYDHRVTNAGLDIFLTTQKGRRVLGERVFTFADATEHEAGVAIAEVIAQFYVFHAPKEIRVAAEIPRRLEIQRNLSSKFVRRVPIVLLNQSSRRVSTNLAVQRSSVALDVSRVSVSRSTVELMRELKTGFGLKRAPKGITAIDVSHISGTDQVAAAVEWRDGRNVADEADHWLSEGASELGTLSEFVARRFSDGSHTAPHLLLIDGGPAQLTAAVSGVQSDSVSIVSAVKPPGEHSQISHFLTADGRRIDYEPGIDSHRLLHRLRDDAHDYANAVHRDTRDCAGFYETVNIVPSLLESERRRLVQHFGSNAKFLQANESEIAEVLGSERARIANSDMIRYRAGKTARIRPLVVPISLQDENGAAEDLRPIAAASRGRPRG
jgi:excinuclease ABC subunit C